jgi:hypothetical protein
MRPMRPEDNPHLQKAYREWCEAEERDREAMTYTRERIEAVAPHGVRKSLDYYPGGPWTGLWRLSKAPGDASDDGYLSLDALVQALNEPLVECNGCDGYGYLREMHGETYDCGLCNGTGTIDKHADLRALIERLEREKP